MEQGDVDIVVERVNMREPSVVGALHRLGMVIRFPVVVLIKVLVSVRNVTGQEKLDN